jgi:hypothetical protein
MKSFLSGRPQHDQPSLARDAAASGGALPHLHHAHAASSGGAPSSSGGPTVECVKQGDKVVRLIVTCACGERIEIDCLYPNPS